MRDGADDGAELRLDQRLVDRLGRLPDPVIDLRGLQRIKYFQQCRLVLGHRVLVSFRENHWRGLGDHHTVALHAYTGTPSKPGTYTTRGDGPLPASAFDRGESQARAGLGLPGGFAELLDGELRGGDSGLGQQPRRG
jgi:hypothetical protein